MIKAYCDNCGKDVSCHEEETRIVLPVRGDPIPVTGVVLHCDHCGCECYNEEYEQRIFEKAFDKYRKKHGIISPEEIKQIRSKYNLSQRSLAALLGWGTITIHRYEMGNIPDEAHNQMLQMINDPVNMRRIFEQNREKLPRMAQMDLQNRLDEIKGGDAGMPEIMRYFDVDVHEPPSLMNGYKRFSADTLENMITYLAQKLRGVNKTKLMKLLWYSDFIYFKLNTVSISGSKYAHLPFGPAPDNYQSILSEMVLNEIIEIREENAGDFQAEVVVSLVKPDMSHIPDSAIPVLDAVAKHFKKTGSKEISDLSHAEDGYRKTKMGKSISYEYADSLKVKIDV